MKSMGSGLVLGGRTSHLLQFYQMDDAVGEKGMQAWHSPTVHSPCSCVCKTEPPGARAVCASQVRRGNWALPGRLRYPWKQIHILWWQSTTEGQSEEAAGRGAAVV